ncbi:hypothetical protein DZC78_04480 [Olleya aquimaris]|nr:hypothetical protein DZC78_04480 [Olleya aquimaris]
MDYLKIYKEQYDHVFKRVISETKEELKKAKKNKKNFHTVFSKIIDKLYNKRNQFHEKFKSENLNSCLTLFENRHNEYDKNLPNEEVILLILSNEVLVEYEKLGHKKFNLFIKELAELKSITNTQIHLDNYSNYYELVFEQERYEYFYGKRFDKISFQNSDEYIEMLDFKYPEKRLKSNTSGILSISKNPEIDIASKKVKEDNIRGIIENEFDTKERAILIYLCNSRLKDMKLTEVIKVMLIVGSSDQFEIFNVKSASNSYLYKQVQKGYDVFKDNELEEKIANLKIKLNNRGLKGVEEELRIDFSKYLNRRK